jgi:hypothetical protein
MSIAVNDELVDRRLSGARLAFGLVRLVYRDPMQP